MSRRHPEPYETYPPEDRRTYQSSRSGLSYNAPRRPSSEWHRDSYYDERVRYDRDDYRDDYVRGDYDREWLRRERDRERDPYDERYRAHPAEYDRGDYGRADRYRYSDYRGTEAHRSRSPHQKRASPSYSSRAALPVSPIHERREEMSRRESYYNETQRSRPESYSVSRDESIPTGPRSATGTGGPPPLGPKAYLGRRAPPIAPSAAGYIDIYDESPKRYAEEGARRPSNEVAALERRDSNRQNQMSRIASIESVEAAQAQGDSDPYVKKIPREPQKIDSTGWDSPPADVTESKSDALSMEQKSTAETASKPQILMSEKLGKLTAEDFPHHACPKVEADAFNASTERLRGDLSLSATPQYIAYRQALVGLADSDIELVGARARSNVTTEALQRAKEDAEAWSLESARIEASERNIEPSNFFTIQPTNAVR